MTNINKLSILIADDHPLFRAGLVQLLQAHELFETIVECDNGNDALEILRKKKTALAILDIDMPAINGLDVLQSIKTEQLNVDVIILTMHCDEYLFNRAIDIGARGFVLKASAIQEILKCISTVIEGSVYYSAELSPFLFRRSNAATRNAKHATSIDELSPSELRVLKLVAAQLTTNEIAEQLMLSPKTIENHRSNICSKLNLHGSNALVKFALANKTKL